MGEWENKVKEGERGRMGDGEGERSKGRLSKSVTGKKRESDNP